MPPKLGPDLGQVGLWFGAEIQPEIGQNGSRSASEDGVHICIMENVLDEPESQV